MTSLNNETALVTGSARGIGRAIAERYAALGANVVINYSTGESQARETVAAIEQAGGTVLAVQANVARAADVDRLFDATLERFGSLDIVVVEVLSKEIGARGVTVNSILPTATDGAGVFTDGVPENVAQLIQSIRPIKRMGTVDDAAEYLA